MNTKTPKDERYVVMGTDNTRVMAKGLKEDTRFLGVWINASMKGDNNVKRLTKTVNEFIDLTKGKKATIAQFIYIYNNVIIPKIEYLHKITHLTEQRCHKIERRAIGYLKNRASLSKTANNNIIFNKSQFDIKRLWDNYTESHITSLVQRLNSTGSVGIITEIRLKKAQLILNSIIPIFEMNLIDLNNIQSLCKNNITVGEYITARNLEFGH